MLKAVVTGASPDESAPQQKSRQWPKPRPGDILGCMQLVSLQVSTEAEQQTICIIFRLSVETFDCEQSNSIFTENNSVTSHALLKSAVRYAKDLVL